ncbi:dihydrolipoamide acetyltransferase family protein [Acidocella sp.]|uniref:dihydrolipoamide acetyltransferase family protein n=1 Tax=Acidocella sp. TaxID=50710 RepID=UPI002622B46C|nr:dihydrolipoamide acetyltransferase family protein [Acidocella sp.]
MARLIFRLPDIGEGVTQAELTAWHVAVGEHLAEDQLMAEVMTDKANVDMTAPAAGLVLALHGEPGTKIPVGAPLIELETDEATAPPPFPAAPPSPPAPPTAPIMTAQAGVLASPATRRRAKELGLDLHNIAGSGPDGRITTADLTALQPAAEAGTREMPITGLRRQIGAHLQAAKREIPHFTYVEEIDMTALEALRASLNARRAEDQPHLTLLPFFMRALVQTLPRHPRLNARYSGETGLLRLYQPVHIGIATQSPGGLLVPVVRHAERLDLWGAAHELARLATAARAGQASHAELTGSTITLSSLGPLGGLAATPIINAPEVAIIAPNKLAERPVVQGGQIVIRTMMNLSASFDHRIIDGFEAAAFIQALRSVLETPAPLAAPP